MNDTPTRIAPEFLHCRNPACKQVLAVQEAGWVYRPLANIQGSSGGRVTLICPACGTRRKFDDDSWRFAKVQEAA